MTERLPLAIVTVGLDESQVRLKARLRLAPAISTALAQLTETVAPRLSADSNLNWGHALLKLKDQHLAALTQALGSYLPSVSDFAKKAVAETYPLLSVLRDYADVEDLSVHFMGIESGIAQFVIALKVDKDSDRSLLISKLQRHFRLERDRQILWSALGLYQKGAIDLPDSLAELEPFVDHSDPGLLELYSDQYSPDATFETFPNDLPTKFDDSFFNDEPYTRSVKGNQIHFLTWPVTENDIRHRYFGEEFRRAQRQEDKLTLANCLSNLNSTLVDLKINPPNEKPTSEISAVVGALRECFESVERLGLLGADVKTLLDARERISQYASTFDSSGNAWEWSDALSGITVDVASLIDEVNGIEPAEEEYLPTNTDERHQVLSQFIDLNALLADTNRLWAVNDKQTSSVLFGTNYEIAPNFAQGAGKIRGLPLEGQCELENEICKVYFVARPQTLLAQAILHPNRDVRSLGEQIQAGINLDTYGLLEGRVSADGNNLHMEVTLSNE
jgi:hypothetical protein